MLIASVWSKEVEDSSADLDRAIDESRKLIDTLNYTYSREACVNAINQLIKTHLAEAFNSSTKADDGDALTHAQRFHERTGEWKNFINSRVGELKQQYTQSVKGPAVDEVRVCVWSERTLRVYHTLCVCLCRCGWSF